MWHLPSPPPSLPAHEIRAGSRNGSTPPSGTSSCHTLIDRLTNQIICSIMRVSGTLGIGCGPGQREAVPRNAPRSSRAPEFTWVTPNPSAVATQRPHPRRRRPPLRRLASLRSPPKVGGPGGPPRSPRGTPQPCGSPTGGPPPLLPTAHPPPATFVLAAQRRSHRRTGAIAPAMLECPHQPDNEVVARFPTPGFEQEHVIGERPQPQRSRP